jgi:hypothetical protein
MERAPSEEDFSPSYFSLPAALAWWGAVWRPQMAQHQGVNPRKVFLVKSANLYIREKYSQFLSYCRPVHLAFIVPNII